MRGLSCEKGERLLFSDVSFSLNPGELLQIEGQNGAGKTSLLRILCSLARPNAGMIFWRGQEMFLARALFLSETSYLGHLHGVKGILTPIENLRVVLGLGSLRSEVKISDALKQVGLAKFQNALCHTLSAGQRRRVALARLLITRSTLWILDEPFTALDRSGIQMVENMLHEHLSKGGAVAMTTHQPVRLEGYTVQGLILEH
ncbi:cytochrome c maturation protein A [Gammaproteobacteria bacterium]